MGGEGGRGGGGEKQRGVWSPTKGEGNHPLPRALILPLLLITHPGGQQFSRGTQRAKISRNENKRVGTRTRLRAVAPPSKGEGNRGTIVFRLPTFSHDGQVGCRDEGMQRTNRPRPLAPFNETRPRAPLHNDQRSLSACSIVNKVGGMTQHQTNAYRSAKI